MRMIEPLGKIVRAALRAFAKVLRRYFITGLILFIPFFLTLWLLWWVFDTIDNFLQPHIDDLLGRSYEGIGFGIAIALVFLFGIIGSRVAGRNAILLAESLIARIPLVRELYYGIKQIMESFSGEKKGSFLKVVFMEFPRRGIYTVALVTDEVADDSGKKILNVYVPTAPNPTSGYLQIVSEDDVIPSSMSVDDALKMIISAGKVSHSDVAHLRYREEEAVSEGQVEVRLPGEDQLPV